MTQDAARKQWWEIAEVVFGLPFLAALALQWFVPLAFPGVSLRLIYMLVGAMLIVGGVVLIVRARREFRQLNQPTDPGYPTSAVVTSGVFSFSRNPMYLGAACFLLGIALVGNLPWVALLLLLSLFLCQTILILPEEDYLAAKFGADYQSYRASVRRWLGRRG